MIFKVVLIVVGLLTLVVIFEASKVYIAVLRARPIIGSTKVFQRLDATASSRVLVIGDSTGVGTGATRPEDSIAGKLAQLMEGSSIENHSMNGMKMRELSERLGMLPDEKRYALILLQIGGNDILRFTIIGSLRTELRGVFEEAKMRGDRVVFMSTGDVGNAPAFGPVLSFFYHINGQRVRQLFMDESKNAGVTYVDLYEPRLNDPFAKEPWVYHSPDGLHPSSKGYALWFEKLQRVLK